METQKQTMTPSLNAMRKMVSGACIVLAVVLVFLCGLESPANAGDGRIPIYVPNQLPLPPDPIIKITESGSYYLTEDIFLSTDQNVIEIDASWVTIDLNGHVIFNWRAVSTSSVIVANSETHIRIHDGIVYGGMYGVNFTVTGGDPVYTIENISFGAPIDAAIKISGASGSPVTVRILNNHIQLAGEPGTAAIDLSIVSGSEVNGNVIFGSQGFGIRCVNCRSSSISRNTCVGSAESGIYVSGTIPDPIENMIIVGNNLSDNSGDGLTAGFINSSKIESNDVSKNSSAGIALTVANKSTIVGNTVSDNSEWGIRLTSSNYNAVENNTTSGNGYDGIYVTGNANMVHSNASSFNTQCGIEIASGSNNVVTYNRTPANNGGCSAAQGCGSNPATATGITNGGTSSTICHNVP